MYQLAYNKFFSLPNFANVLQLRDPTNLLVNKHILNKFFVSLETLRYNTIKTDLSLIPEGY